MSRGTSQRFDALDGLRAIAVLVVLLAHVVKDIVPGGWLGVELFFVLSGYLITTLLLGERARTGGVNLRAFYARRFLRLMPALVVVAAVYVLLVPFLGEGSRRESVVAVLYLMDVYIPVTGNGAGRLGHTWSLAVEEQFYLVWPFVLVVATRRGWRLPRLLIAAAIASTAIAFALAIATSPERIYVSPFPHVPALLIGVMLAFAVRDQAPWLSALGRLWVPAVGAAVFVIGALTVNAGDWWLFAGGYIAFSLVIAATLGHLVTRPEGAAAAALSVRPMVWLGQRSYGFYLWHMPLIGVAHHYVDGLWVVLLVAFALTLVATELSWRIVEQPFLQLKRRFESPAVPVTAAPRLTQAASEA